MCVYVYLSGYVYIFMSIHFCVGMWMIIVLFFLNLWLFPRQFVFTNWSLACYCNTIGLYLMHPIVYKHTMIFNVLMYQLMIIIYLYIFMWVYMYVCMSACVCVWVWVCVCVCVCVCVSIVLYNILLKPRFESLT